LRGGESSFGEKSKCAFFAVNPNKIKHFGQKLFYRLAGEAQRNPDLIATSANAGAHARAKSLILLKAWIPGIKNLAGNLNGSAFP
jgi:hypothetical protein